MPNTARVTEIHEEQPTSSQAHALRLVEAETRRRRSRSDHVEAVGLVLIVLASWFVAALLLVPQLSGLL